MKICVYIYIYIYIIIHMHVYVYIYMLARTLTRRKLSRISEGYVPKFAPNKVLRLIS